MSPFGSKTNERFERPFGGRAVKTVHDKIIAGIRSAQAYTKFWVAVAGAVVAIIATSIPIDAEVSGWIVKIIAVATAFSVYKFPNAVPPVEYSE